MSALIANSCDAIEQACCCECRRRLPLDAFRTAGVGLATGEVYISGCRAFALVHAAWGSDAQLPFAFPKTHRVENDPTIRPALEGEPRPQFVLFVDDVHRFVFVRLAVAVDSNGDLTLPVFDD